MRDRPILMSGPMVRALLDGRKTQTRRIIRQQPPAEARSCGVIHSDGEDNGQWSWLDAIDFEEAGFVGDWFRCPYGISGDLLWIRESWRVSKRHDPTRPSALPTALGRGITVMYQAGGSRAHDDSKRFVNDDRYPSADGSSFPDWAGKGRPGIHLPRWASRLTLRITDIRVEGLQSISDADAIAEGIGWSPINGHYNCAGEWRSNAVPMYRALWESINGPESWAPNPWVWAITFEVEKRNVDDVLGAAA